MGSVIPVGFPLRALLGSIVGFPLRGTIGFYSRVPFKGTLGFYSRVPFKGFEFFGLGRIVGIAGFRILGSVFLAFSGGGLRV